MALPTTALAVYAGDTKTFSLSCLQDDGVTPRDLTGNTGITLLAKRSRTDPDAAAVITATLANSKLAVVTAGSGLITLTLAAADTNPAAFLLTTVLTFTVKAYYSGAVDHVCVIGTLTVAPDDVIAN